MKCIHNRFSCLPIQAEYVYINAWIFSEYVYKNRSGSARSGREMYTMSSRTPIQVPTELRDQLSDMQNNFYCKTQYEVIQRLIKYYNQNEEEKAKQKAYQDKNMIDLGAESKEKFNELKDSLKLRQDSSVFKFLAYHWETSLEMNVGTFDFYRTLQ